MHAMFRSKSIGISILMVLSMPLKAADWQFVGLMAGDSCSCDITVTVWHIKKKGNEIKLEYSNPDSNYTNKCKKVTVQNELEEAGRQDLTFTGLIDAEGKAIVFQTIQERFTPYACPLEKRIVATYRGNYQARLVRDTCTTDQKKKIGRVQLLGLTKFNNEDWPTWISKGYFLDSKICAGKLNK